jgi:hypothetical protein
MIFGLKEMKEFAESSDDPRVKALWKRLGESMSKNAKWCDRVRELEDQVMWMRPRIDELLEEQRWRRWPDEKPEKCGLYQCICRGENFEFLLHIDMLPAIKGKEMVWNSKTEPDYWRPIGQKPGEVKDES